MDPNPRQHRGRGKSLQGHPNQSEERQCPQLPQI